MFVGSYLGQGAEVTLAIGSGYFGYPSPLSGAAGYDLQFPASAPAGTKLGLLQANGETAWHTYDGANWSLSEPSLATMQAVQIDLAADLSWATHGMPDFNSKPKLRAITGAGTYLAGTGTLLIGLDAVGTPMSIQWTKNSEPIVGATQRQLQLVNLTQSHAGRYAVTLRNAFGIENSNPVEINVHYSLTTTVAEGEGTIEINPSLATYPPGTTVTLTARPGEGLGYDEWEGDASGSAESVTLVMDDHKSVSIRYIADNQPPTVAITSPKNGRFFSAPSDVVITAAAADADGSIASISYEHKLLEAADWVALGQAADVAAPFTWEGASEGVYEIRATVTDNRGAKGVSAPIQITLTTGNLPPVVVSTSPAAGGLRAGAGQVHLHGRGVRSRRRDQVDQDKRGIYIYKSEWPDLLDRERRGPNGAHGYPLDGRRICQLHADSVHRRRRGQSGQNHNREGALHRQPRADDRTDFAGERRGVRLPGDHRVRCHGVRQRRGWSDAQGGVFRQRRIDRKPCQCTLRGCLGRRERR